jgi:hypothetical protein
MGRLQRSWQIRRSEVYVQKGYSRRRHVVNLNCIVCISAKHMKRRDVKWKDQDIERPIREGRDCRLENGREA